MKLHTQAQFLWDAVRNPECTACPLHTEAHNVCVLGDGPVPAMGMVVGEAPGYKEDEVQIPFSGASGVFLRRSLKEIGLDPRSLYITNTAACKTSGNRPPTRKEIKTCSNLYLTPQLERVKPKAILLLGNTAVSWAIGKKASVTKMEGSTFTLDNCPDLSPSIEFGIVCVPSRHPSSVIRAENEKEYPFLVQKFKENLLLFKNTLYPKKDDFEFSKKPIALLPGPVYTDIESNGLNPFKEDAKIHCVGFTQDPKKVCAFPVSGHTSYIINTLKNHPIIAHRTTFEGTWYKTHYGVTPRIYHDTKVCAYMIDENEPSGLKYQAIQHLGVDPWSEEMDFTNPDLSKMLPYNARDNSYGMRLYLERDLPFLKKNPKIARLLRYIIYPAIEVFTEVICNGFHIDEPAARKKLLHCEVEKKKWNKKLNKIANREINPGSPKQLSKLFYDQLGLECPVKTDKGANSTSEAALIRLAGKHEAVDMVAEWRNWEKKRSTYLEPWIRQGPILHALYGFTDTDTGRLNSTMIKDRRGQKKTGAVIHQCPRDPFIRNLVVPRNEGWRIVACDLSQGELRLVAHAANDPTMIDIFNRDSTTPEGDIHYQTARSLQPQGEIIKETRKKAKAVNFGFVFGMMAAKFVAYALEKFGVTLSFKEGKEYRQKFFSKYSTLESWHRRVGATVSQNGYIDSILGRRRHLPQALPDSGHEEWAVREAVRQAINSPIQSACSDLLLFVVALIASYSLPWKFKIDREKVLPVGSAHDSGLFEAHPDYAQELKEGILWTVQNLPLEKYFKLVMRVPIVMDCHIYEREWEGKQIECH